MAGRRGPTRREEMIMTQDKARKAATRQRMAETGEPYSVARHAVETEAADQSAPEPAPAAERRSYAEQAQELADRAPPEPPPAAERRSYAEQAQDPADRARRRADEAQDRADQAQERAERAEEAASVADAAADMAAEAADLTRGWADADEQARAHE